MWWQSLKTAEIRIRTPLKLANYFRSVSQRTGVNATIFISRMQKLMKNGEELWTQYLNETKYGICTSLKSDFYFRFHSQLNTKLALLNLICTWHLVLKTSKIRKPHISKLLPVCLTNNRHRSNHISEPHAKFGENRQRIVDIMPNQNQILNLHISKIRFLFPVSFAIEQSQHCWILSVYGICADLLKNVVTRAWKLPKS